MKTLDLNNEVIRDFGFNKNGEFSVISEDLQKAYEYCKDIKEVVNIYPFDSYVKCDNCQTIVPVEESEILEDGNIYCYDCIEN